MHVCNGRAVDRTVINGLRALCAARARDGKGAAVPIICNGKRAIRRSACLKCLLAAAVIGLAFCRRDIGAHIIGIARRGVCNGVVERTALVNACSNRRLAVADFCGRVLHGAPDKAIVRKGLAAGVVERGAETEARVYVAADRIQRQGQGPGRDRDGDVFLCHVAGVVTCRDGDGLVPRLGGDIVRKCPRDVFDAAVRIGDGHRRRDRRYDISLRRVLEHSDRGVGNIRPCLVDGVNHNGEVGTLLFAVGVLPHDLKGVYAVVRRDIWLVCIGDRPALPVCDRLPALLQYLAVRGNHPYHFLPVLNRAGGECNIDVIPGQVAVIERIGHRWGNDVFAHHAHIREAIPYGLVPHHRIGDGICRNPVALAVVQVSPYGVVAIHIADAAHRSQGPDRGVSFKLVQIRAGVRRIEPCLGTRLFDGAPLDALRITIFYSRFQLSVAVNLGIDVDVLRKEVLPRPIRLDDDGIFLIGVAFDVHVKDRLQESLIHAGRR